MAGLSLALLAAFCAYRLAGFRLLPLDSSGTLHEILWPLFARFRSGYSYMADAAPVWVAWGLFPLFLPVALALGSLVPLPRRVARIVGFRGLFSFSVALCLVYWRFPILLGGDSNPDEAEFLAASTKLLVDPVFFRSIETNTSGPFNIFPLAAPALFGISPDYATTRVIALVVIFLTLYLVHRALREIAPDGFARVAILPALGFFSLATYPDFQHYSSELIPMLVISLAVLACVRVIRRPEKAARYLPWLGCLVSAGFFAKPQSVPILAAACAAGAAAVYASDEVRCWWRPVLLLAAGFAPLQAINVLILARAGALQEFWIAYLVANWKYGRAAGGSFFAELPALSSSLALCPEIRALFLVLLVLVAMSLYATLRGTLPGTRDGRLLRLAGIGATAAITVAGMLWFRAWAQPGGWQWGCSLTLLAAAACVAFLVAKGLPADRCIGMFGALAAAILGASVFSIYASHLILQHYTELMIVPISVAVGWLLIRHDAQQRVVVAICAIAVIVGTEIALLPKVVDNLYAAQEKFPLPEGRLIDSLTSPGSPIVVWGWRPEIYLSAGRIPATRDTNMSRFFNYGKDLNLHYQERFLRDMKRTRPELVVDAVDTSCCSLNDRKLHAFELIPAINAYIQSNYVLVAEQYKERFYLRRNPRRDQRTGR